MRKQPDTAIGGRSARALLRRLAPRREAGAFSYPIGAGAASTVRDEVATGAGPMINRHWAEIGALVIGAGMLLYILYLYTRFALPPGTDSGQWLAVSRFYLAQHVPEGRSVATVPPVIPVLLAGLTIVAGAKGAIVAMAAMAYAAFCFVAFKLGSRLTGEASGGLLAVVAIAVVQSQLFEFFAMGAFPQLAALLGMAVALYALLALVCVSGDQRAWLTLAAGVALTLFSHTPSATVLLPALAMSLAYVAWSSDERAGVLRKAALYIGPVFALWMIFLFVNRDTVFGYANVPAAYDLKGPDKMFNVIFKDNPQRIVFGAGLAALLALPFLVKGDSPRRFRAQPSVLLAVWTLSLMSVVAVTAFREVGTDYPRFIAYFIVPLGLAAAAGIHSFHLPRPALVGLLVPVLLLAGQDGLHHFNTATRFYGMNDRADDLTGVSAWLDSAEPGGVIAGTRETKWLEALSGRDTLLYMPRIYITRKPEIERAIQAEVVFRSNGAIETGRMLIAANDGGQDFGNVFPPGVRFDVFQKGLYTHAVTLRDETAAVTLTAFGASQRISLAEMESSGTRTWHDSAGDHLATTYFAEDQPVSVVRVVSASGDNLAAATIDYYIGAPAGVHTESLTIGTGDSGLVEVKPGATTYLYPELSDGSFIEIEAKTQWLGGVLPPQDANQFLEWRRASVHLDVGGGEHRVPHTQVLDPQLLLERENIRYIVDRNGDGAAFPIIRQLSLSPVYQNEVYNVYELP